MSDLCYLEKTRLDNNLFNSFQGIYANLSEYILMWYGRHLSWMMEVEMKMDLLFPKQKLDS